MSKPIVFVAMSGGVDSSVAALLLQRAGYRVRGVYMKNWSQDINNFHCPWEQDMTDASAVAAQLGIDIKIFDFQKDYKRRVVDYMINSFKIGITPNPDVMCNQEIKFKLFIEIALNQGADLIATGHYAQTSRGLLFKATDSNKDQTYFLYRINREALKKTLFPLGGLTKTEVRRIATEANLVTAQKKDSVGICFVGKVPIKSFLGQYIKSERGAIIDQNNREIGFHDGAVFYTIGQRHGLKVGGGLPYYVVDKDIQTNTVFVTTDLDDKRLWSKNIDITKVHWISEPPKDNKKYQIVLRYRSEPISGFVHNTSQKHSQLVLDEPAKAVTLGQSAVVYDQTEVLGGGVISARE